VVTRDDVARGKPYPDLFLEAARRLGVPPARCLAFEDSYNGVRAAAAAGVPVVMVPDLLQATPEMHAVALRVFGSLHEVLPCISDRQPLPLAAGAG
jgi:beta-phosphoglucomutase-like phosphatase (HAD superfamily)